MSTNIIKQAGGVHIANGPLTTNITEQAAPGLIQNAIDRRIVKVRPIATPIDQISRCGGAKHCGSMKVEYYSVDTKAVSATVTTPIAEGAYSSDGSETITMNIKTSNNLLFEPSETLIMPSVMLIHPETLEEQPLVLYVISRDASTGLQCLVINNLDENGEPRLEMTVPAIIKGTEVVRMGRAATELDVQTAQFESLPVKRSNLCQIFKMQVEQSTFQKLANKEVGWDFSDQEEAAVIDLRLGIEKNFLFGRRATILDPVKREPVHLTGGIWYQTDKEMTLNLSTLTEANLIDICREAFTGSAAGSNRKILVAGTLLVDALSKLPLTKCVRGAESFTRWGLEFREIVSNFGSLYVIRSEVFDQCGHTYDGFVLDPDYITKYVHVPFHTESLDLRRSGVRNTDAIVITEASCLVLRHPQAHMRIIGEVTNVVGGGANS